MVRGGWLVLRPFRRDDVDWVYRVARDRLTRQFVTLPDPYLREHAEGFVEMAFDSWARRDRVEFVAEELGTGLPLGRIGMSLSPDRTGEVGYWVDPLARGRGVATLSLHTLCRWAFEEIGLQLLEWRTEVGNHASRRVAEKVGFTIEATLRYRLFHRGVLSDAWVGSLLPNELLPYPLGSGAAY
jgi:RimJ/RimL family protein N-acetyltransferase